MVSKISRPPAWRALHQDLIRPSLIATLPLNVAVSVTTVAPEITRSAIGVVGVVMSSGPLAAVYI